MICRRGSIVFYSGILKCVYAPNNEYNDIVASSDLPAPKAGIVYTVTPNSGILAIDSGRIRVYGGQPGNSYRFHDCYVS